MKEYESELLNLIPKESIMYNNLKNLKCCDMWWLLKTHFNINKLKCSRKAMINISEAVYPYILTGILKTEIIDNENNGDESSYCYFYEDEKLKYVIILN
jgi:hypothetical protein